MIANNLGVTWEQAWLTVVTATGIYLSMIALSRVFGQRQFSMSSTYDLAFVFALGSLIGRVVLVHVSLLNGIIGLATMFVLHAGLGWLHHHVPLVHRLMQNRPILLVAHGEVYEDNLNKAHTSHLELFQAMRLAGTTSFRNVTAAILERNGSISIVRRGDDLDPELLTEVVGKERLHPNKDIPS